MAGNLFVVVAPSGAGKTSLVDALLRRDPNIKLSMSYTTRAPRPGERDGVDYHFVTRERFESMIGSSEFLEHALVHGNYYGTSKRWIDQELAGDHDVLLEIDWQGAAQVRRIFRAITGIFILPPSLAELRRRLEGRGKDSPETIARRLANASEEISHVLEFEYIIVNDSFDSALEDLLAVVRATRVSQAHQASRLAKLIEEFKERTRAMARITVDDCIKNFPNRFELTLAATNRARQIALGATPMVEGNKDKPTVIALREIAAGKVGKELLNPPAPTPPVI